LLLIEVSDTTLRYDLNVKARLYATHGVREYWVVDLVAKRVWRHRKPRGTQSTSGMTFTPTPRASFFYQ